MIKIQLRTIESVKKFCDLTNELKEDVFLIQGRYTIDAKSMMGVFSLNLLESVWLDISELSEEQSKDLYDKLAELEIAEQLVLFKEGKDSV